MRRGCGRAASDRDIDPEQRGDALLFAAESSDLFTRVVVSSDLDFAVAQICYSTTPESAAIVLPSEAQNSQSNSSATCNRGKLQPLTPGLY